MNQLQQLFFSRFLRPKSIAIPLTEVQRNALEVFEAKRLRGEYQYEEASCICGANGGDIIAAYDRYLIPANYYLCNNCGAIWITPRMDERSLTKFYDEDYRAIHVGSPQASDKFFEHQITQGHDFLTYVTAKTNIQKDMTVFDVGCGAGGALIPFRNAGWRVYGCDLGSQYLDRGRSAGLTLEHGDINTLRRYGPADLIIMTHVLEHLPNPHKTIQECSGQLRNRGYLLIEVPGTFNVRRSHIDIRIYLQSAHLYQYTLANLSHLLAEHGFERIVGDEVIRALFQLTGSTDTISIGTESNRVLRYLINTELLLYVRRVARAAEKIVRAVLGNRLADHLKTIILRR